MNFGEKNNRTLESRKDEIIKPSKQRIQSCHFNRSTR